MLTVTTDKGDLVLDNKKEDILLWSMTGYRFVKRQSQSDPSAYGFRSLIRNLLLPPRPESSGFCDRALTIEAT